MELEAERLKSLAAKPRFVPCRTGGSRRGPHVSLICQSKSEHIIRDDDIADVDGRTLTINPHNKLAALLGPDPAAAGGRRCR
jgi:hypothetical protein